MDISNLPKGMIGQFYDTSPRECLSMSAEDMSGIPIGLPVMRGSDRERQVMKFNGGVSNEMLGIAAYSALQVTGSYSNTYKQSYYPAKATVTVLNKGKIWVPIYGIQTINVGDTAYIDTLGDKITNTYVQFQTVPIGKFLTGGASTTTPLFVLELIPGYTEEVVLRDEDQEKPEEVLSHMELREKAISTNKDTEYVMLKKEAQGKSKKTLGASKHLEEKTSKDNF